jgi:hypothetical protein
MSADTEAAARPEEDEAAMDALMPKVRARWRGAVRHRRHVR